MKKIIGVFALAMVMCCTLGCEGVDQDDPELNELLLSCQTSDPIKELRWLADLAEKYEQQSLMYRIRVVEFDHRGYILIEDPTSSSPMSTIFDCQGEVVLATSLSHVHYNEFITNIRTVKVLQSKNWP